MKHLFNSLFVTVIVLIITSCSQDVIKYDTAAQPLFDISTDNIEQGESIDFFDKSIPLNGTDIVAWKWIFDFDNKNDTELLSYEQNPTVVFNKIGDFKVQLTVTDSNGSKSSIIKQIKVNIPYNAEAHASFLLDGESYNMNTPVQFKDTSVPAKDSEIISWKWNFGENDKSISSEQNPSWIYTSSGSFTITLDVEDSKGNKSSYSSDILVMNPQDLISIKWKTQMLGAIENTVSPAMSLDGTTVYMWADQSVSNAYDVVLKAFDSTTGNVKWSFNVNDEFAKLNENAGVRLVYGSPSVGNNGDIYVCARDLKNSGSARKSFLIAIKPDGTKHWHYSFGIDANFNYITPAVDKDGFVYISHLTTSPFEIAVLDPNNGEKVKQIPLEIGARSGISINKNKDIFFCSTGNNGVYSYSYSGQQNWQYNENFSTTGGEICIDNEGTIYTTATATNGGLISAISKTGNKKWQYSTPGELKYGGLVIDDDGTVYSNGGTVVPGIKSAGVYALSSDGSLKWHFSTEEDVCNCVPLIDNRGYIHFVTDKGTYYVLTDKGLLYGEKKIGSKCYSSPVMNANGDVCIAAQEDNISYVYCLDTGATDYKDTVWPMKGQNPQRNHLQK